jgi:DNA-binding response OmpR family regulator
VGLRKVLVLDESAFNGAQIKAALVAAGFDAEIVAEEPAFVKAIEWWRPDAVVVDAQLSSGNAGALARSVKESGGPPIVLAGAVAEPLLVAVGKEVGAAVIATTLGGLATVVRAVETLRDAEARRTKDADEGGTW